MHDEVKCRLQVHVDYHIPLLFAHAHQKMDLAGTLDMTLNETSRPDVTFPFGRYSTINLFGVLFTKRDNLSKTTINHESIHTEQIKENQYRSTQTALVKMEKLVWF